MFVKQYRWSIFIRTALMYGAAQILALLVAHDLRSIIVPQYHFGQEISLLAFLGYFAIGTVGLLVLMRLYKGGWPYRLFFYSVVIWGIMIVFERIFPLWIGISIALIYALAMTLVPVVWVHDLAIVVASAGIGASFGMQFAWPMVVALMGVLSVYDIVAVYYTKHMIAMAHAMLERHAIFALFIPGKERGFFQNIKSVQPGSGFMLLGGGDIVIPMFLAVSALDISPIAAVAVVAGSLLGLLGNHITLMRNPRPLPALPGITAGACLGLIIGMLL